jgi:N-acyl-D-aspartate/D-glutamate deacylase
MPIHFAVSVGHIPCRMAVMGDAPAFLPPATSGAATRVATEEQLAALRRMIERGLDQGAVAVGFGLQYTPGATHWESWRCFAWLRGIRHRVTSTCAPRADRATECLFRH